MSLSWNIPRSNFRLCAQNAGQWSHKWSHDSSSMLQSRHATSSDRLIRFCQRRNAGWCPPRKRLNLIISDLDIQVFSRLMWFDGLCCRTGTLNDGSAVGAVKLDEWLMLRRSKFGLYFGQFGAHQATIARDPQHLEAPLSVRSRDNHLSWQFLEISSRASPKCSFSLKSIYATELDEKMVDF